MSPYSRLHCKKSQWAGFSQALIVFFESKKFFSILACLLFLSVSVYIWEITQIAGRGYELKRLEKQMTLLQEETRNAELVIAEQTSTKLLRERALALGMRPAEKMNYLAPAPTLVARR